MLDARVELIAGLVVMLRWPLGTLSNLDLPPAFRERFDVERALHELRVSDPSVRDELPRPLVRLRVADDVSQIHEQVDVAPKQHSSILAEPEQAETFDSLERLHRLAK